jgi:predicted oxidoreductase
MKYLTINKKLKVSQLVMGCMRFTDMPVDEVEKLVKAALDEGINFFDHADIYGRGKCETLFGQVLQRHPE